MNFGEQGFPLTTSEDKKKTIDFILERLHDPTFKFLAVRLLNYFVKCGYDDITWYFLHKGCDVNARDTQGDTPLIVGLKYKQDEIVHTLLSAGANILDKDCKGRSALSILCADHEEHSNGSYGSLHALVLREFRKQCSDSEDCAKKLIDAGCHIFQAAFIKDAKIIEYMLKQGLSSNSMHPILGKTALHIAVGMSDLESLKLLLKYGADAKAVDNMGQNALSYVHTRCNKENTFEKLEILRILLDREVAPTLCTRAGFFQIRPTLTVGNRDMIRLILQLNIDFAVKDGDGSMLLHYLSRNDNPDIVEELKLHITKFDITAVNKLGLTPLHWAAFMGNVQIVTFLLEQGADSNCATYVNGFTPLYCVCIGLTESGCNDKYEQCIELLLQHYANPQFICTLYCGEPVTVFDLANINAAQLVIAHLALLEQLGTPITTVTRSQIRANRTLYRYFHLCRKVLKQNISGSITLMKLLTTDRKRMIQHMCSRDFVLKLNRIHKKPKAKYSLPHYYNKLEKFCSEILEDRRLKNQAAKIISKLFGGNFGNINLIINKVVDYLSIQNLRKLCSIECRS